MDRIAYVFTLSPKIADPAPGPRPAPELARYDRLTVERSGEPDDEGQTDGTGGALGVLSDVLERDGQQLSALQTQQQALSSADHLAMLHATWTAETSPAREQRYKTLLMDALPPGYQQEPSHQVRWLWHTMRAAELVGLDPGQAVAAAIGERPLTGARDVPSVIDARLRHRVGPLVPLRLGPWREQVPDIADLERRAFAAQIADMMDARKVRIGEHAADNALPWAVNALGPVPDHPLDRLEWRRRASSIGAYRELSGHARLEIEVSRLQPDRLAEPHLAGHQQRREDLSRFRRKAAPHLQVLLRRGDLDCPSARYLRDLHVMEWVVVQVTVRQRYA
jgi:hypothetical protein